MSNSALVKYTKISPNKTVPRNKEIDRITIHCVVGQCSCETLGEIFAKSSRKASSNYGIGVDGRVAMFVEEKDRSWCSSNAANDNRAVTIECASDTSEPYAVNDAVYSTLLNLCEDICKRNGKNKLLWFGDKQTTLNYKPASNEMVMTVHRWFANKSCPGTYLMNKHASIAQEVTRRLQGVTTTTNTESFLVKVTCSVLNIRAGAGTSYKTVGAIVDKGTYTIVDTKQGADGYTWGKLKSGAGWIALEYTKRK